MKKIVLATANQGKLKEFKKILSDFEIISMKQAGFTGEIEETGKTFRENALIKAKAVAKSLNVPALADDSGLCVNALGGAPGIYSARYSKEGNDKSNRDLLLKNMQGISDRSAKFVCSLCYFEPDGKVVFADGETQGEILTEEQGTFGFGYDPVFLPDGYSQTFGELPQEVKNRISHRAAAFRKALEFVEDEMSVLDNEF